MSDWKTSYTRGCILINNGVNSRVIDLAKVESIEFSHDPQHSNEFCVVFNMDSGDEIRRFVSKSFLKTVLGFFGLSLEEGEQ